jgi:hypothetical protein
LAVFRLFQDVNAPIPGVVKGKTYVCSGNGNNVSVTMTYYKEGSASSVGWLSGNDVAKAAPEDMQGMYCYISVPAGATVDETVYPKLQEGSTATPYTPYVDVSKTKLTVRGKNLFDASKLLDAEGWTEENGVYSGLPQNLYKLFSFSSGNELVSDFAPNTQYTFSFMSHEDVKEDGTTPQSLIVEFRYEDGTRNNTSVNVAQHTKFSVTSERGKTIKGLYMSYNNNLKTYLSDIQLEIGTSATPYEPFIDGVEYTPSADGSVDGVASIYPIMSLLSDTDGVVISCEYNQDTNKAIEKIKALPKFELINTITVVPDTDGSLPQNVLITADSGGNLFELTDFYVNIAGGFSSGSSAKLYVRMNNNLNVITNATVGFTSDALRKTVVRYRQCADGYIECNVSASGAPTAGTYWNPQTSISHQTIISPQDRKQHATVKQVSLGQTVNSTWIEGSTFELWGVRKK